MIININNRPDQMYLKTLTVLYVEDDPETREQFCEFLSRPVGTLITAADGNEGWEMFHRHSPDIVVTDILMPRKDGLTMAEEIRQIAPTVPIIVITAFEQTDYLMRAINIGIDKYVTKPVNSYLLFECLLECAHRLRAEDQLKLQHQREIQQEWSKHNEAVAILAGGIAHDYNNLMQAILGYAALAKMKVEPGSEASDYLQQVEKCSDDACKLSRMLQFLGTDYLEEMQTGSVMHCIEDSIRRTLAGTSITLMCKYPQDLPEIKFLHHHMQLVSSGMATNALEAMPDGGTLLVSAEQVTVTEEDFMALEPGSYIRIQLADTGTGMTPEVLSKVFYPYYSTKQKGSQKGVGLSLTLCRTVIMKHGGIITAESNPGSGATFNIWLPVSV